MRPRARRLALLLTLCGSACGPGAVTNLGGQPDEARVDGGSGSADAGGPVGNDDGGPGRVDAGATDGGWVAAFVAQGHLGRTTVSCDLGRTWVANRDDAPPNSRCWMVPPDGGTEIECDHQPTSGRGIAFGREHVVANFGWGPAGEIRRSRDGVHWEVVQSGKNYGGTANVGGRLLFASETPDISDDDGETLASGDYQSIGTVRRGGGGESGGALFVIAGDNGLAVSSDGLAWRRPTSGGCTTTLTQGGIQVGNGVAVIAGSSGVCRSTDRGDTWTSAAVQGTVGSMLVWTGSEFVFYGPATANGGKVSRFASADGEQWQVSQTFLEERLADGGTVLRDGPALGPIAFGDGVFVGVNRGWERYYEQQRFYRSDDGTTWEALPPGAFEGSHPITHIAYGLLDRGGACP